MEVLPVAPPPKPRELTEGEVDKIEKQREAVLRELRVFLRDATNKLLAERKFKEFAKPVDPEEVEIAYEHTHTYTQTHTHTHAHTHTHTHTNAHTCTHTHMHTHTRAHTYAHRCTNVCTLPRS